MLIVGSLIVAFGVALIVLRGAVRKGIENKAKKIGNPIISKSVKQDGVRRIAEAGFLAILIGVIVILDAAGVF